MRKMFIELLKGLSIDHWALYLVFLPICLLMLVLLSFFTLVFVDFLVIVLEIINENVKMD